MKRIFLCLLCGLITGNSMLFAQSEQSQWSAVFAGETLCDPVLYGDYFFSLTADHAINCIDYTGSFVWRRNITKTSKPFLSVSGSGILIAADSSGLVQAVSSQGIYLWSFQLVQPPVYAPYAAQDGSIYIVGQTALMCLSIRGKLKWQLPLPAPLTHPVCETGTGLLLLVTAKKELLTVTRTGEERSRTALKKEIKALASAPDGYLVSAGDGTLTYYRSTSPNAPRSTAQIAEFEVVWESAERPPLLMKVLEDELLCVYADGTVSMRKLLTNRMRWTVKTGSSLSAPVNCLKVGREYYLSCSGFAAIITDSGTVKHEKKLASSPFVPLITPNGAVVVIDDWVLNSWQLNEPAQKKQLTFISASVPEQPLAKNTEMPFQKQNGIPFFIPNNNTEALLDGIEKAVAQGITGAKEAEYAHVLQTILTNSQRSAYYPYTFTIYERSRAAELLGQFESLEYRPVLLAEARKNAHPMLAASIIRALGVIASDPDRQSIIGIQHILQRCGTLQTEPAYAACEAFTEIAKYGDKQTASAAMRALFGLASNTFPENIRRYARQKIKSIVK